MKFVQVLLCAASVFAAPLPQAPLPRPESPNTKLLLDTITAQERALGVPFRFLKTLARTYTSEIEKYSLPDSNITVFLPSDDAFLDIAIDDMSNGTKVAEFVKFHGASTLLNASAITPGGWSILTTFLGQDVKAVKHINGTVDIISTAATNSRVIANATFGTITAYFVNQILNPPASVLDTVFQHNLFSFTTLLRSYLNVNVTRSAALEDVTVFVPSELAISQFVNTTCVGRRISDDTLKSVLEYHITKGKLYFSGFSQVHNKNITTLQGMNVTASYNGTLAAIAPVTVPIPVNGTLNGTLTNSTAPFVPLTNTTTFLENQFNATLTLITPSGNATIVQKDIIANDAILHFIDRVMVPPGLNVTCV